MNRTRLTWVIAIAYIILAVVWEMRYRTPGVPSDFDVFWRAGDRFLHGGPLYPAEPIDTTFLYPPFAAFLFQFLALFPLRVAAGAAAAVNTLLIPVAVWLTWYLVKVLPAPSPTPKRLAWSLILATAVTVQSLQANAGWIQTNLVILVLVLAGVAAGTRTWWFASAAAIIAAAGIKVVPLIFLAWLILRSPRRVLTLSVVIGVGVIAIPLLWRGPAQGWVDLTEYFSGFLTEYLSGQVRIRWDNYNLSTLAYSPFVPLNDPSGMGGPWLPGGEAAGAWLYRALALMVVTTWVGMVLLLRRTGALWNAYEVAATFTAGLLLSGVTWSAHLVPLVFISAVLFSSSPRLQPQPRRFLLWTSIVMALISGIGQDLFGATVHGAIRAYHIVPLFLVVAFVTTVWLALASGGNSGPKTFDQASAMPPEDRAT